MIGGFYKLLDDEAEKETITISMKEYNSLKEDADFLFCLEDMGVDNWNPGYEEAQKMLEQLED